MIKIHMDFVNNELSHSSDQHESKMFRPKISLSCKSTEYAIHMYIHRFQSVCFPLSLQVHMYYTYVCAYVCTCVCTYVDFPCFFVRSVRTSSS